MLTNKNPTQAPLEWGTPKRRFQVYAARDRRVPRPYRAAIRAGQFNPESRNPSEAHTFAEKRRMRATSVLSQRRARIFIYKLSMLVYFEDKRLDLLIQGSVSGFLTFKAIKAKWLVAHSGFFRLSGVVDCSR